MGGVSSAIDSVHKVATFGFGILREQRIDFVMGRDSGSGDMEWLRHRCICCGLKTCFNLDLRTQACSGDESKAATAVFSNRDIVSRICENLASIDLLTYRTINRLWNLETTNWLQLKRTHETRLTCEGDICQFLQLLKNVSNARPFGDLVLDLWELSLGTIIDLSRETCLWVKNLSLSGVAPGCASMQAFIIGEISAKVAVMLHGATALESLSVKTDFQVSITGILDLVLPTQFPKLDSLLVNTLNSDRTYRGNLLEAVMSRSPGLTTLGIILPDGDEKLQFVPALLQQSTVLNVSLATEVSATNIQSLREEGICFTGLRIRVRDFEIDELREALYSWLAHQSETLITLGLTLEASGESASENWTLPSLKELEVLSILIVGSNKSNVFRPFHPRQFPKLASFAFVQSSAKLELFREGVFPKLTAIGFSGKNESLGPNLAAHLPNLKHVTLCGVSRQHVATVLTKFTSLIEFVLIFEPGNDDLWAELTGGIPRSWEDFFDVVFQDINISGSIDEDWNALISRDQGDYDPIAEETLFQTALEGLEETSQLEGRNEAVTSSSLANMKCLEYLKFMGWNAGAFLGLVHMSSNKKFPPLSHLQLQIPKTYQLPEGSLDVLRTYHKEVSIDS